MDGKCSVENSDSSDVGSGRADRRNAEGYNDPDSTYESRILEEHDEPEEEEEDEDVRKFNCCSLLITA